MKRIVEHDDGARSVSDDPTSKAKGAAGCRDSETLCFKCRQPIGMDRRYHQVNEQLVHATCARAI